LMLDQKFRNVMAENAKKMGQPRAAENLYDVLKSVSK